MSKRTQVGFLILTLLLAAIVAFQADEPTAAAPKAIAAEPHIVEYVIPQAGSQPGAIAVEEPGRIWFTMPGIDRIGLLVVDDNGNETFDSYQLATGSDPYDILYDGRYIWYTARGTSKLGRLDPNVPPGNNATDEYDTPDANSGPAGMDITADKTTIWLTTMYGSKLLQFDIQTTAFIGEYAYVNRDGETALLDQLLVRNNDSILFTAPDDHQVVEFTPSLADEPSVSPYTWYTVVDSEDNTPYAPADLTTNEKNNVWVSVPDAGALAQRADLTQILWVFLEVPTAGARPTALTHSVEGNSSIIWFVDSHTGQVGQYVKTLGGKHLGFRMYPLPSPGSQPSAIAVDAEGHAWISEPGVNKIAEWAPPYFDFLYLPVTANK